CSSGTYIRALARDLGGALGTGGHLTALRRTSVGPYGLSQARTLEDLSERPGVIPLAEAAAAALPPLPPTPADAPRPPPGVRIPAPSPGPRFPAPAHAAGTPGTPMAAFAPDGSLVALVTEDSGRLRALAVFADPSLAQPAT